MQLQAVLWYIYIYNMTFITQFLNSNPHHVQPDGQPTPHPPIQSSGYASAAKRFTFRNG